MNFFVVILVSPLWGEDKKLLLRYPPFTYELRKVLYEVVIHL